MDYTLNSMDAPKSFPDSVRHDLEKAVAVLRRFGASEVYVFGSVATGASREDSDIDIGVVGLPKDRFFAAYGSLLMELNRSFDLVALDYGEQFAEQLRQQGTLYRVA